MYFKTKLIPALILMLLIFPVFPVNSQPAHLAEKWIKTGGPIGGMGYDVRHSFENPNNWYVTDAWGGIFLSTDRGLTWTEINSGIDTRKNLDGIPIFCVAVNPHNSENIWIGTELMGKIYSSSDAGKTWIEKSNGIPDTLIPLTFRGITIDPVDPDILFAMAEIGSPAWSPNGEAIRGLEMDKTMGIVFKSENGGESWRKVWTGNNLTRYCFINPKNTKEVYISTGIFDRESANTDVEKGIAGGVGILKSTDGGETWSVQDEKNGLKDLYIGSLYMHPENPDTLLAAVSQNNWSGYGEEYTGGIYLTVDGGENWIKKTTEEDELFGVAEYCECDPSIAYVVSTAAVYRSKDAGFSWTRYSRDDNTWGPPGVIAGFPIDLQCDPEDPMRIIVNNYLGGNFISYNGGKDWNIASQGYTGSLVRCLAVVGSNPHIVYAGTRSGVFYSKDGGNQWFGITNPPPGIYAKFNEISTLVVNPFNSLSLRAVAMDYAGVFYSFDGGKSWDSNQTSTGISKIKFFKSDSSILYGLSGNDNYLTLPEDIPAKEELNPSMGLYLSVDGGMNWEKVDNEIISGEALATYEIDPYNPDIVYVSKCDGTFLKTVDGGFTWSEIGNGLPKLPMYTLAISAERPNILYAGLGYNIPQMGDGLYKSVDGGMNWEKLEAGLEANPMIKSIVTNPLNDKIIYLTDFFSGVYYSDNEGETWTKLNENLDHREANILQISSDGSVLYLGTEGGGVYRMGNISVDIPVFSVNENGIGDIKIQNSFPNPFTEYSTLKYNVMNRAHIQISIFNLSGKKIRTFINLTQNPGQYEIKWDGKDSNGAICEPGIYILNIRTDSSSESIKIFYKN